MPPFCFSTTFPRSSSRLYTPCFCLLPLLPSRSLAEGCRSIRRTVHSLFLLFNFFSSLRFVSFFDFDRTEYAPVSLRSAIFKCRNFSLKFPPDCNETLLELWFCFFHLVVCFFFKFTCCDVTWKTIDDAREIFSFRNSVKCVTDGMIFFFFFFFIYWTKHASLSDCYRKSHL